MIRVEDLSQKRQQEFIDIIKNNEPWNKTDLTIQYAIGALNNNTLANWEKFGFKTMKTNEWVYEYGKKYYEEHQEEIDTYLNNRISEQRDIPVEQPKELTKKELEKMRKEEEKYNYIINRTLNATGIDGWSEQWYERIKKAHKEGRLYISTRTGRSEVELLLASNLTEAQLTTEEKIMLMAFCHPQNLVPSSRYHAAVLSPEWHRLTNWRRVWEVKADYPATYKEWCDNGIVPIEAQRTVEEEYNV